MLHWNHTISTTYLPTQAQHHTKMETDQILQRLNSSIEALNKVDAELPEGRAYHAHFLAYGIYQREATNSLKVAIAPVKDTRTVWKYLLRRLDTLSDQLQVLAIDKRKAAVM